MTLFQKIKYHLANLKRHYKLFTLLALALYGCYSLFFHFYQLQKPYVLRTEVKASYEASNELAACNQSLDDALAGKEAAIKANNPDLFTNNQ